MTKYEQGNYSIVYFNTINAKMKKKSKNYNSYGLAREDANKWLTKHPGQSYIIMRVIFNSLG